MQFLKGNLKLKLVEGFKMPEQEFIKGENGAKGTFKKTGGEIQMFKLTFVEQDEFKTSLVFNTKNNEWNHFEDSNETVCVGIDVVNDPFTGKLKTPKLISVQEDPDA